MSPSCPTGNYGNADQAANHAWFYGPGAMSMRSNTNLQGQTINRTVPLNIQWNKSMLFYGDRAEFMGDIQAEQESSRLACQQLQVFFDRTISLKEGNRQGGQPARVGHVEQRARALSRVQAVQQRPGGEQHARDRLRRLVAQAPGRSCRRRSCRSPKSRHWRSIRSPCARFSLGRIATKAGWMR